MEQNDKVHKVLTEKPHTFVFHGRGKMLSSKCVTAPTISGIVRQVNGAKYQKSLRSQ